LHKTGVILGLSLVLAGPLQAAPGYDVQPWRASQPQPGLALADLQGQVWRLEALKGRVVLVNFWASWCPPCLAEMPSLQTLSEVYGPDKLVVLAVNFKQSRPSIEQFVQKTALQLPVLPDPQGQLARQWGVKVFPTTILIDARGQVRAVVRGEMDWTSAEAERMLAPLF